MESQTPGKAPKYLLSERIHANGCWLDAINLIAIRSKGQGLLMMRTTLRKPKPAPLTGVYNANHNMIVMRKPLSSSRAGNVEVLWASTASEGDAIPDNDLVAAIAVGDHRAFAILIKRHLAKMVMLAQRIVFDREQAREIAQEAFLRVWKHAASWDPDGSATFLTWLRHVVVNLAISARRRYREQVNLDAIEELPSPFADGFDTVMAGDRNRVVREALAQLPERQRAAVALYYFDDLPQVEAAAVMRLTPRAFDSLIVRARANLKKHFAEAGLRYREGLI